MKANVCSRITFRKRLFSAYAWLVIVLFTVVIVSSVLVIFFPLSLLFRDKDRRFLHQVAIFWAKSIIWAVPQWNISVSGLNNLKPGTYVIVCNHQSVIDIFAVLAALPLQFKFMAKKELFNVPFLGWHLSLTGYIPIERSSPQSGKGAIERAERWIKRGVSVLFFPEGTRSEDGAMRNFKSGAFKLAEQTQVPVLPVVIFGTGEAIPKKSFLINEHSLFQVHILPSQMKSDHMELSQWIDITRADMADYLKRLRSKHV